MEKGLTTKEVFKRLKKYGNNEISRTKKLNPLSILFSQFTSPLILLLIIAAIISFAIGFLPGQEPSYIDSSLIIAIVLISGIAGFIQDYKAEKTIEALRRIATPKITVFRDGNQKKVNITELVPGDLIYISEGDIIPADSKLIESFDIEIDESILTGESNAVNRIANDIIFKSTMVNSGNGKAIVLKTGMNTKVGNIALKMQDIEEGKTPFQIEINSLSKKMIYGISLIIFVMFIVSLFKYSLYQSALTAIALAVAAIPEGLPAVFVLVLAMGAKVMSGKNALVRKLSVVESSSGINIICTDKTGTLTKNEMTVTKIYFNDKIYNIENINNLEKKEIEPILLCGYLCNNTKIGLEKNKKVYFGDQTEIALKKISDKYLNQKYKYEKISEISFNSERKMMSTIHKRNKLEIINSKGAPEFLLEKCGRILINGKIKKLSHKLKDKIIKQNKKLASEALRVIGFAYKEIVNEENPETNLVWLGLQAMIDPPKNEVKKSLLECKTAGIRVIMLTGDNPQTAKAIADKIGLNSNDVLVGSDIEKLSYKKLEKILNSGTNIFARISPFHKLKILEILIKNNRVAMTGDGVNDALALKKADIGISMGIRGTEVAKEASDIILLDDNFSTIVSAVKEGRRSFDNIRKFINYLLVCNFAEVGVLFLATLFLTLKEPILLPIHLLWINLLTDGLPALALGLDPARPDIMKQKPREKKEHIINRKLKHTIIIIGLLKIVLLFAIFFVIWNMVELEQAKTALFTGFILFEFVRIGVIRHQEKLSWFVNKWLLASLIGTILLQLLIIYSPLNSLFQIVPLVSLSWIVMIIGVILVYFISILISNYYLKKIKD